MRAERRAENVSAHAPARQWRIMYGIRDDQTTKLLYLQLSGRVHTAEAARAVSQAFALAEAGQRTRLLCDLREVSLGPDEPGVVASLISARSGTVMRFAFVGNADQLRQAAKLARVAGIAGQAGVFSRVADAEAWLLRTASRNKTSSATRKPESQGLALASKRTPALAGRGSAA